MWVTVRKGWVLLSQVSFLEQTRDHQSLETAAQGNNSMLRVSLSHHLPAIELHRMYFGQWFNMVIKRISQQGIFNENLRRSFEKLVADKRDLKMERKVMPKRQRTSFPTGPRVIKLVNSSSESELDSMSPDISTTFKPFNRKFKTRYVLENLSSHKVIFEVFQMCHEKTSIKWFRQLNS